MKKTINIHLGGMPFVIDEDAYIILHDYLENLKAKFSNENERAEIIADIEARIAEVFTKRLEKRQVVDETDVNFVIAQLGKPEDIASDSESEQAASQAQQQTTASPNNTFTARGEKKLFRDGDNKIVGGVISGLCQYFGISDPIWARLACVLALFAGFGTPVLAYFVLMALVPEAKTAAEKLQMRGEPVTLDNIQKEVQDTVSRAKGELERNEIGKKATSIGTVILKVILVILAIKVFLVGAVMTFFFLASIGIGFFIGEMPDFAPFTRLLFNTNLGYYGGLISLFFAGGIPLFCLLYFPMKYLVSRNFSGTKRLLKWLIPAWVISLVALLVLAFSVMRNFSAKQTQTSELTIVQPKKDTLYIASSDSRQNASFYTGSVSITGMHETENGFVLGGAEFELQPSKDHLFHIEKVLSARGRNKADAQKNIQKINYRYTQTDSVVALNPNIEAFKNASYRRQEVKNIIYIPAGKYLKITDENLTDFVLYDETFYAGDLPNKIFTVKNGKVVCENCTQTGEESDDNNGNAQVSINGNGNFNINASDSTANVHISISGKGINVNAKEKKEKK